ncbi:MAG: hypothetical protein M3Q37_09460 [Gemmatimonadota bacterium]|nr:hypothetical protein [Gemmatimonadota bacterium]
MNAPAPGISRDIEYQLRADAPHVELGWFVVGSMRIERDFQYAKRHLRPYSDPPFVVAEESLLVAAIARLPASEGACHVTILGRTGVAELRHQLLPVIVPPPAG